MTQRDQQPSDLVILQTSPESSLSFGSEPEGRRATTVNITTLNVTYSGDNYSGNINDGFAGGRHNRDSSTSCQLYSIRLVVYGLNTHHRQSDIDSLGGWSDTDGWDGWCSSAADASSTIVPSLYSEYVGS